MNASFAVISTQMSAAKPVMISLRAPNSKGECPEKWIRQQITTRSFCLGLLRSSEGWLHVSQRDSAHGGETLISSAPPRDMASSLHPCITRKAVQR